MKRKLVALTAAVACVLPLAGCATGPQGDMTDIGFSTGTVCIDGRKFAVIWDSSAPSRKDMEPLGVSCEAGK